MTKGLPRNSSRNLLLILSILRIRRQRPSTPPDPALLDARPGSPRMAIFRAPGLTSENADQRLHKFGPNELSHTKQLGFFADIFERCKSPLVIQLLLIAAISALIGEIKSTVIVGTMVLLSVGLSYILDRRSTVPTRRSAGACSRGLRSCGTAKNRRSRYRTSCRATSSS